MLYLKGKGKDAINPTGETAGSRFVPPVIFESTEERTVICAKSKMVTEDVITKMLDTPNNRKELELICAVAGLRVVEKTGRVRNAYPPASKLLFENGKVHASGFAGRDNVTNFINELIDVRHLVLVFTNHKIKLFGIKGEFEGTITFNRDDNRGDELILST